MSKSANLINHFFLIVAALVSSGIMAFSYIKEWAQIKVLNQSPNLYPENPDTPYFHASETIYVQVLTWFGIYFFLVFCLTLYFTLKKKWPGVMFGFFLSMMGILAVMINGAIK